MTRMEEFRGNPSDKVFTERLWRSIKYESIYIKGYQIMREADAGINEYIEFYYRLRFHKSLDYRTPEQIHDGAYKAKEIIVGKKDMKTTAQCFNYIILSTGPMHRLHFTSPYAQGIFL